MLRPAITLLLLLLLLLLLYLCRSIYLFKLYIKAYRFCDAQSLFSIKVEYNLQDYGVIDVG